MITIKAISTISYNSKKFLVDTLSAMIKEHLIEFFAFIQHEPEEDETKRHKHIFIIPSCRVDTFSLQEKLREPDPLHPENPLGCIQFKSSKFVDWYLYGLHDPDYLAMKGESRKYKYFKEEFVVSDSDYFLELIHTSDFAPFKRFAKFRDMCLSGVEFKDLVINGFVPIQQIYQYEKAFYKMRDGFFEQGYTYRGNRDGHEGANDVNTLAFFDSRLKPDNADPNLPFSTNSIL